VDECDLVFLDKDIDIGVLKEVFSAPAFVFGFTGSNYSDQHKLFLQ
jgi:hypothetical protein